MNKLVNVHPQKQLATQKSWPKQEEIKDLARRLDRVKRFEARFDSITKDNVRWRLEELQQLIEDFENWDLLLLSKYTDPSACFL